MSAPPFTLHYMPSALAILDDLASKAQYKAKAKKVAKALRFLEQIGPSHPGLETHRYQSVFGPNGDALWESYVENNTPGAWRIWWSYGPGADVITIVTIGPHPD